MDRDGTNKRDLTKDSKEFAYGFSASPDGRRIAYHKSYKVYVADADGSNAREIPDRPAVQLRPRSGRRTANTCCSSRVSTTTATRTSWRPTAPACASSPIAAGYRGVVEFLDVPDFHGGSSDIPAWSADGKSVFYTAKVGPSVELFRVSLDGQSERLTRTPEGSLHYHPTPSPDGRWLAYGSKRDGVRQLYVMSLADRSERRLTELGKGHAAMWPHWQPRPMLVRSAAATPAAVMRFSGSVMGTLHLLRDRPVPEPR